jgi:large subunit ribosomal protein L28e
MYQLCYSCIHCHPCSVSLHIVPCRLRITVVVAAFIMVHIPDQLLWEVTRKNSSFLRKKNGHTKRSGKINFSAEPGNLKNLHLLQYSGISNAKVIDVVCTPDNKAQLITKAASKCATNPSKTYVKTNVHQDFRRAVKIIAGQTSDVYYRQDLKAATLAKYTKVYQANRRAKGIIKSVPCKKGRGNL